jgi:hypothetical protein
METYKGIIYEPNRPASEPGKYGTVIIPANQSMSANFPGAVRRWAKDALRTAAPDAYCVICKIEEVEVERFTREEVINAPTNK